MYTQLISTISLLLSLLTVSGVMLHDSRIDKATSLLATPLSFTQYDTSPSKVSLGGDAHTHVERSSFSQAMRVYQTTTPSTPTRSDGRKHLMQRHAPKGHHAFDNYNLPLVS
jgi:hypothetical protein